MASNSEPTLGVHLLETITKGMYSEPLHSMREYVQNAYDSIRAARRQGVLRSEEGEIRIGIDADARTIRIRDDGTGLSPEAAAVCLLDLGSSEKAGSDEGLKRNAGFRGIGRMSGITYCSKLRFVTSDGGGKKCVVEFDAAGINRLTQAGQKATTIIDAISKNSRIEESSEAAEKRYLEVILEGINKTSGAFLDEHRVAEYLARVAPVAYDDQVWSFGGKIREFAEATDSASSLDHVCITIRNAAGDRRFDVRRSFKDKFSTTNNQGKKRHVTVNDVIALPRGEPVTGDGWWGWMAVHEREGALAEVPFAGLRIRMHNIAIGDAGIVRDFYVTSSHALWSFGEIHVTDHTLTPNSQRDNFEDSAAWLRIKERLRDEVSQISREIRKESGRRNSSVRTLAKRAAVKKREALDAVKHGFVSRDEKKAVEVNLEEEVEKLERQKNNKKRTEGESEQIREIQHELEEVREQVASVKTTRADIAQAHLGREARRVLRRVREILLAELDEKMFRKVNEKINLALQPGRKD